MLFFVLFAGALLVPPILPPTPHKSGRPDSTQCGQPLLITELLVDPAAVPDRFGEFVELYNHGTESVSLSGWCLSDGARDRHVIRPRQPLSVAPGQFVVLGINADAESNGGIAVDYQYRRFDLRNSGDRVVLSDPCGTPVFVLRYPARGLPRVRPGRSLELVRDPADGPPIRWRLGRSRLPSGDRATPGFAPWRQAPKRASGLSEPRASPTSTPLRQSDAIPSGTRQTGRPTGG